ncbi:MAG: glycoside hydrolase family 3 N-terminal domain-containing protein [Gemmatimonadota bacterium]
MRAPGGLFVAALRLDRWPATRVRQRARRALELEVAGFLLFGGSAEEVSRLTRWLREEAGRALLLAADLERGAGQQFRGATRLPPPAALAAHPDPEKAVRAAARLTAEQARELGINWVLAPVLDLDAEPRNPIVGTRSFGADPERVAELGRLWVQSCQRAGVACCAKHFPGHGRTTTDSHTELPVVTASRERMEADLVPFGRVADCVESVMTAHVAYPALGASGPAALSEPLLRGLLRRDLGFRGLVVTDALIMAGFRSRAGREAAPSEDAGAVESDRPSEGALMARAVAAGCDLLLYPRALRQAVSGLERAVAEDSELARAASRSLRRIGEFARRVDEGTGGREQGAGGRVPKPGGRGTGGREARPGQGSQRLALGLAVESLRAVGPVPGFDREGPTEILGFGRRADGPPGAGEELEGGEMEERGGPGAAFADELGTLGWQAVSVVCPPVGDTALGAGREGGGPTPPRRTSEGKQRIVVLGWPPRAWSGGAEPDAELCGAIRRTASGEVPRWIVVLGHPRILAKIGAPGLCAWSDGPLMERAAARWLNARIG